jgi:hypothetical protein
MARSLLSTEVAGMLTFTGFHQARSFFQSQHLTGDAPMSTKHFCGPLSAAVLLALSTTAAVASATAAKPAFETQETRVPGPHQHWGGSSSSRNEFAYEAPPGWIILSVRDVVGSKYGDSWYTISVMQAGAQYSNKEAFTSNLDELEKFAASVGNKNAAQDLHAARSASGSWEQEFYSAHNAVHVQYGGSSHEKTILGAVVDTDTASLNMDLVVTIARLPTTVEKSKWTASVRRAIARGEGVTNLLMAKA